MNGFIHSTESFGTVDGPGVRFVVFLQGCPMRCQYCHNPDTWKMNTGTVRSAQSLIQEYERNKAFYAKGGITVTGGEALMQIDFLLELFAVAWGEGDDWTIFIPGNRTAEDVLPYIQEHSVIYTEYIPGTQIVAMSTCSGETSGSRLIVFAMMKER